MSDTLLELKGIDMVFTKRGAMIGQDRRFHVLKNVDMSIGKGEIVALVGESGCGKTTIGKIITGLLKPTRGEIIFEGDTVNRQFGAAYQDFRNSVQFIQQDSYAALNPARTIFQSLCAAIESVNKKISRIHKEASRIPLYLLI